MIKLNIFIKKITLVSSLLLSPSLVWAMGINEGLNCIEAVQGSRYEVAMQKCELEAEEGNAQAAEMLGFMSLKGNGGPRDWKYAKRFLEQSVKLGNLNANRYLGVIYWNGLGVKVDHEKAHELFKSCLSFDLSTDISCTVQYAKTLSSQQNSLDDKLSALAIYQKLLDNHAYEYSFNYSKLALNLDKYEEAFIYAELFIRWAKRYGDLALLRQKYNEAEKISAQATKHLTDEELTKDSFWVKHKIFEINKAFYEENTNPLSN